MVSRVRVKNSGELVDTFTRQQLIQEKIRRDKRDHHLKFMDHTWMSQVDSFIIGLHTRKICERLDAAIEDYKNGISSYIRISVHHRSGKSEIVSVNLPPRFLAMLPESEIMQVSYNQGKAQESATKGMRLVETSGFQELFPNTTIGRSAVSNWNLVRDGKTVKGHIYSAGLMAGLIGRGYHLGILDDYCGSKEQAESSVYRNKTWDAFTNDFLTRQAPVSITIILATWWHADDLHGQIENKNNPDHEDYDPDFPVFEHISFPAKAEDYQGEGEYPGEYLFEERMGKEWYPKTYAFLGEYSSSAVMDCDPTSKFGAILNTRSIKTHASVTEFPDIPYYRVWDLAHTEKQRIGADPDFTGGTLLGFQIIGKHEKKNIYALWIKDYVEFREKAVIRDKSIEKVYRRDGNKVRVIVENSLDSKDAAEYLKAALYGLATVTAVNCKGDKVVRCTPLEPIFEAGNVHILNGEWNKKWKRSVKEFDGTGKTHDEAIDNMTCGYKHICDTKHYTTLPDPYTG